MPLLLTSDSLGLLPASVAVPRYDFTSLPIGIVHLGIGAFHRAHQAVYTDDALAIARDGWGICGVSLRSPDVRERMSPQDGLYTVVEKSATTITHRVVGSVREVLFRGDQLDDIVARIASPDTKIVSLTVTEKGYSHDPASGKLNFDHVDIAHDLREPHDPHSTVGLIVHALERRRAEGGGPLTVLCCDNLTHNGKLVESLVDTFARERDSGTAQWIAEHVSFPCTMVDRIVPAATDGDLAAVRLALGVLDLAPVVCEPFRQWVIEGRFAAGRPAWELAGAQFVDDVAPFEKMKIRLLNASHSAFAYLGYLAGYETIWQVAAQPDFISLMQRIMDEATPTLTLPADVDLPAYKAALMVRFANPALPHRTQQIAMDGSQKLPHRVLGTIRDNLAAGRPIDFATLTIAGWMRYVTGIDESAGPIKVSDPMADQFAQISDLHRGDPAQLAHALLGLRPIFDDDLPSDPRFVEPVIAWLSALFGDGALRTVTRAVRRESPA